MEEIGAAPAGTTTTDAPSTDTLYTAQLESADATTANLAGEVVIVANDDNEPLEIVVRGTGLTPGEHGWHVHAGACDSSGEVRIPLSDMGDAEGITDPIDVDDSGQFEESVEVPQLVRSMVGTREHSLHIHLNPGAAPGPTVACATI
jgi:Cu/Zn superoxide dismutase